MSPAISFAASASSKKTGSIYTQPQKKQKMSITQTYFLAHSARGKLSKEASRPDHDLRLLVGHANMLDSLMIDLANAEQEQERWFSQSVSRNTIPEEDEEEWEASDLSDSDDESEDEDANDLGLALTRTVSRKSSPPELTTDADSDSEDEQMPPSPPNRAIDAISEKDQQDMTPLPSSSSESFEDDEYYLPSRNQPTIIAAY